MGRAAGVGRLACPQRDSDHEPRRTHPGPGRARDRRAISRQDLYLRQADDRQSHLGLPSGEATMIIVYVDTASTAGGDGTTPATAGANRAFASLREALDS